MFVTIPLIILGAIAALLPWWLLFRAIRAGRRMSRPERVYRHGHVPLSRPGNPGMGTALILIPLILLGGWLILTRPLWATYVEHAWEYRTQGAAQANLISAELMRTGQPLGPARMGRGYVHYYLGEPGEPFVSSVAYYWRGSPVEPGPADPVETTTNPGVAGVYALTYRRDLPADDLGVISQAFERINAADDLPPPRRAGVDVPLLLRSVQPHWQGYFGFLDNVTGVTRFIAGLPALPPMYLAGLVIGALPSR